MVSTLSTGSTLSTAVIFYPLFKLSSARGFRDGGTGSVPLGPILSLAVRRHPRINQIATWK